MGDFKAECSNVLLPAVKYDDTNKSQWKKWSNFEYRVLSYLLKQGGGPHGSSNHCSSLSLWILQTPVFFLHKANYMCPYLSEYASGLSPYQCLQCSYQDMLLWYLRSEDGIDPNTRKCSAVVALSLIWTLLRLHFGSMIPFLNRGYISHSGFTIQCFNWWMLIQSTGVEWHIFFFKPSTMISSHMTVT